MEAEVGLGRAPQRPSPIESRAFVHVSSTTDIDDDTSDDLLTETLPDDDVDDDDDGEAHDD